MYSEQRHAIARLTTNTDQYLRIASLSIALYDYVLTLPSEWRFYSSQKSLLHPSLSCILFALIRYMSIIIMIVSNYGFFSTDFTPSTCHAYYLTAPVFKALQMMISHAILGVRTYNISRRSKVVGWTIVCAYIVVTVPEWIFAVYRRIPVYNQGNCTPGNDDTFLVAWLFYLFAMVYDLVTLCTSTGYLLQASSGQCRLLGMMRALMYDGLIYFVALTAVNIFNMIIYRSSDMYLQSAGASLAYAVTWIMSQKILIHLREAADRARRLEAVVVTRQLQTARDITQALRSQFESRKGDEGHGMGSGTRDSDPEQGRAEEMEMSVSVRVERSVTVEYNPAIHDMEMEGYGPPRMKRSSRGRR